MFSQATASTYNHQRVWSERHRPRCFLHICKMHVHMHGLHISEGGSALRHTHLTSNLATSSSSIHFLSCVWIHFPQSPSSPRMYFLDSSASSSSPRIICLPFLTDPSHNHSPRDSELFGVALACLGSLSCLRSHFVVWGLAGLLDRL